MEKNAFKQNKEPTDYEKTRKSLDASLKDQSAYAVSLGITTTYMIPFAVALRVSPLLTTAIAFLPDLIGSTVQLSVTSLMKIFRSRKKMLVLFAFLEALTWLPLIFAPYLNTNKALLIFISLVLNNIFLSLVEPLWSSLMSDIVDERQRGRYFGKRMKALGMVTFFATAAAALILSFFARFNVFIGFSILFAAAFLTRLISTYYLTKVRDVSYSHHEKDGFSMIRFIRNLNKTNFGRFLIFSSLFNFAIFLVGPFYVIYMQDTLNFSYFSIMFIILAQVLASFITMDFWGKIVDKHGSKKVMLFTGFLLPLGPLFWIFKTDFIYLFLVEFLVGVFMAGFKLASANFVFDSTRPQVRLTCLAYYNFFTSVTIFLGAVTGSLLYAFAPAMIKNPAFLLFGAAFVLRLAFVVMFLPVLKEERLLEIEIKRASSKQSLTVIPMHGVVYDVLGKYRRPIALSVASPAQAPSPFEMPKEEREKLTKKFINRVVDNYGKKFRDY